MSMLLIQRTSAPNGCALNVNGAVVRLKLAFSCIIAFAVLFNFVKPVAAVEFGPLFEDFDLTLSSGHRTEAAGPFYYSESEDTRKTWAVPPLFSSTSDTGTDSQEIDFLYPIITYDRYGEQYRWQFCQVFNFSGGPTQNETARDRFSLFPLWLQQRSSDPTQN